jgi:hypothetical protein
VTDPSARTRALLERIAVLRARLGLAGVLQRIRDRTARGRELERWPLPRPEPVDPDSSLAADDDGFLPGLGGDYVRLTALYPIMSTTDCLAAVARLVDDWEDTMNSHEPALLILCRSALETAAKTIWLLGSDDRAVRRKRCVGFVWSETSNQKSFHTIEERLYSALPDKETNAAYRDLQEHIRLFREREKILKPEPKATPPNDTRLVINSAKWVDRNLPPTHGRSCPTMVLHLARSGPTWSARRHPWIQVGQRLHKGSPWPTARSHSMKRRLSGAVHTLAANAVTLSVSSRLSPRGQQCIADRVRHDGNRETLGRQSTHPSQPYANR